MAYDWKRHIETLLRAEPFHGFTVEFLGGVRSYLEVEDPARVVIWDNVLVELGEGEHWAIGFEAIKWVHCRMDWDRFVGEWERQQAEDYGRYDEAHRERVRRLKARDGLAGG